MLTISDQIVFFGIDNIHAMRESLSRLREYLDTYGTTSSDGMSSYLVSSNLGLSSWHETLYCFSLLLPNVIYHLICIIYHLNNQCSVICWFQIKCTHMLVILSMQ